MASGRRDHGRSGSVIWYDRANEIEAKDFGADTVAQLKINDTNGEISLKTCVEAMQFSQKAPQFAEELTKNKRYNHMLLSGGYNLDALYETVSGSAAQGRGTVIGVYKEGTGGHALLAYGAEEVSATQVRLFIYDCNFPLEKRYLTLERKEKGKPITGWAYDMGGNYGVWGTGDNRTSCYISYVEYETVEYIWTHRGKLYDNKEMLSVSAENFGVMDFEGKTVAEVENGQLSISNSGIIAVPNLSMYPEDSVCLYMPKDHYTVYTPDESMFEATMADYRLSATAKTTSGAVTFAVDDWSLSNTVYIENAGAEDSYSVSLQSDYGNIKYNNVTVSGMGIGGEDSICISGNQDTLFISNCNIDSLNINGEEQVSHMISAYAGAGGRISPSGDVKVAVNDEATFEFAPELGYRIENIRVDDIDLGALTTYTFKNNYRNHSITAFFKAAYAVTDAVYDRKTNSLSVELINESRIKAVCAVYDSEGTMAGAAALSVKAKMGEFTMPLSGIQVPETGTIRVMILDSKWIPLCRSYTITY